MTNFQSLVFFFFISISGNAQDFVKVSNGKFYLANSEYKFFGTNYWYGGLLAVDSQGKERLINELDFLANSDVTNLRVMISAEGDSTYPYRISPSLQLLPRVYNEKLLRSYDYFLAEAGKRNMKVVFVLSNNWEWSGGFGKYLEWAKYPNPILPKTPSWDWDKYCDYISQFYSCDSCQRWYLSWIKHIVTRKNTFTNTYYHSDPTIMTWELANEPRPMKKTAIEAYKSWVELSSNYIKFLDKKHLVTIGVEGMIGTAMDSILFKTVHQFPAIDYTTIHIWPKTWAWYNGQSSHAVTDTTLAKTKHYIESHARWSQEIKKPLVIEEFGMHRDDNVFSPHATTKNRNKYFSYIFEIGQENGVSGYNFWGAIACRGNSLKGDFWTQGSPYTADPPQEEQGLYGLYDTDIYSWVLVTMKNAFLKKLSK